MNIADLFNNNPFAILELSPGASNHEIERQGKKILGMLELGLDGAAHYSSPLSVQKRDASLVRQAMADLHDPVRYHFYSFWFLNKTAVNKTTANRSSAHENSYDFLAAAEFLR